MSQFITSSVPFLKNPGTPPMAGGGRGFIVHNDFSAASQSPQIDRRSAVGAAASRGDIGQGLQQLGGEINKQGLIRLQVMNERKVLEADSIMRMSQADLAKQLADEHDTNKWEGIARKHVDELGTQLIAKDLSPDARDAISNRHLQWSTNVVAGTLENATQREVQLYGQQQNANYIGAMQEGQRTGDYSGARSALDARMKSGTIAPDAYQFEVGHIDGEEKKWHLGDAQNKLTLAFQKGAESEISGIMEQARKIPGVQKSEFDLMEQTARINAKRQVEQTKNKASADLYGSLVLQQAQGVVIVPAQIDSLAAAGKLDPIAAARLRQQSQSDTGANPGDFNEFINQKVLAYNPDDDKDFAKKQAILQEAFGMGLRQDQAARFSEAMNAAEKRNATPRGRVETQLKKWGLEHIDDMHKNGDLMPWKSDAAGVDETVKSALADPAKMSKVLGVELTKETEWNKMSLPEQIASEVKRDPQKALDMFAKAAKREQQNSGLDAGSYNYLMRAIEKQQDRSKEIESGAKAAELQAQYEQAFDDFVSKNKRLPSADEARGMIGTITKPFQDTAKWKVFVAPKVSMAAPDEVGIRGFEPADDLATKLPTPLASYAQDYIDAARLYNLDPYALAAISIHETNQGKSSAFVNKNNAMGTSSDAGPVTFGSVRESIMHQARSLANSDYYAGKNTLEEIGDVYAPTVGATNDPGNLNRFWKAGVTAFYNQLRN